MKRLAEMLVIVLVVASAQAQNRPVRGGASGRDDSFSYHPVGSPSHRQVGHDNSFSYRVASRPVVVRRDSFSYSPVVVVDHSFDYGYGRSYGYGNSYYYNRSGIDYRDEANGLSLSSTGLFETMIVSKKLDRALDIAEAKAEADRRREDSYAAEAEFQQLNALARDIKTRQEAKQQGSIETLAQENEQLKQELLLKRRELELKAENQKLKDELKKLEAPAQSKGCGQ
ncbi:MAG: hypothetical protein A2W71_02330 [Candidatus Nealsonbacteria bacterium RIFCSPLOWO2_02_39_8]|uniref:BZIP domain-containing protein n=1 Tax=Candidatus Nealsonbacteria bacterium RIFCSPLOWO2_02_39_8 TaxID=1801674 RepID=A0A1G2EK12_9BACT|nr:MAG: hypothetical protein US88_C0006G0009 [Parcubacteria group bacterium GW2011_GWA2_38_27]OGZ21244.1 MAG: hypothetical protein A3C48_02130 [Candidatus Nealsonbacteria bacterium RIFCSPHIGHO2_02_FULL_38_75]OGZ22434.1 MAG: hypothetical protein A2981_00605 [Candidatus Nealsonbacteria bacterium RIFCSPLOWO2_01_FULL_38_120]OGZ25400.1 MAG: hypothetical protein A3I85_01580 [Candidatus Nealsonbacteria bacterium RIFCSPLOWO2_02_FULL_38_63]OGZ25680.1 MAG: hypothetical protein A2W71_02330 [Candidatus Nea